MKRAAIAVYAFIVVAVIFLASPGTFLALLTKRPNAETGPMATFLSAPAPLAPSSYTYLGNPRRTQEPFPLLEWPLRKSWESPALNLGVHTASKGSVAADDSGVYVGGDSGWFYAYDHGGKLKWKFRTGANPSGIHGTALLTDTTVYFGAYNGRLYAFEKNSGRLLWLKQVADAIGSSPFLAGGELLVSAEFETFRAGFLAKLDAASGAELWRTPNFPDQVHSSPSLSEDGRLVFVGDNAGYYRAFDLATGMPAWLAHLDGAVKGTGLVKGGRVYVTSWGKSISAFDTQNGRLVWRTALVNTSQSSPAFVDGVLVVATHRENASLYGIQASDGTVIWKRQLGSDYWNGLSSPAVFRSEKRKRNLVLFPCETKRLCVIDPRDGRILYRHEVPEGISSVPTIHNGSVYLTFHDGPLMALTKE